MEYLWDKAQAEWAGKFLGEVPPVAQRAEHSMPNGETYPSCFDPYLRYAIATDFRNFEFFDEDRFRLFLLVELKDAQDVRGFEKEMGERDEFGTEFGPDVGETRYVTMRCRKAAVTDQHGAFRIWRQVCVQS